MQRLSEVDGQRIALRVSNTIDAVRLLLDAKWHRTGGVRNADTDMAATTRVGVAVPKFVSPNGASLGSHNGNIDDRC